MATQAQTKANAVNAKKSTGPRTATGKSASSRNALTHGLTTDWETLFGHSPELLAEFESFASGLSEDFSPEFATEEVAFRRYAFAAFQAERARRYEVRAEADMLASPDDRDLERRYLRFAQLRVKLSRETEAAFRAYRKLRDERVKADIAIDQARFTAASDLAFCQGFGQHYITVDDDQYREHLRNGGDPNIPRKRFVPPQWSAVKAAAAAYSEAL